MVNTILAIVLFLLSAFDCWLTQNRIRRFGPQWEANKLISWLTKNIGPELGSIVGVMTPATALIAVGLISHLQWVLALLLGFRARMFFNQLESLMFQKQIEAFKSTLEGSTNSGPHRSLPVAPSADVEPKKGRTLS